MEDWCSHRLSTWLVTFFFICPSGGHLYLATFLICPGGGHLNIFICPGEGHFHLILVPVGTPSGINHFLFDIFLGMRLFAGIGDHIVPRLHFGPDGLHMTFGLDWIALIARI